MHVFVTGATGFIGRTLCAALLGAGHAVTALSRSASPRGLPVGVRLLEGDPTRPGPWQEALALADACVNLAGEPIAAGRWTEDRKRRIRASRVQATAEVASVVAREGPRVLVNGSAVGYYGSQGDIPLDENSPPGDDFLAEVVQAWEAAAVPAAARARVVLLRTGIVLAPHGGALERMLLPFKAFVGGPIGDGAFWQPWIHIADEVEIIRFALENASAGGPLNATAPEPVRNLELARAIGEALHRPSAVPTPVFAIRAAFGELASSVIASQRVLPKKALALGFRFRFPRIDTALADLLHGAASRRP